MTSKMSIKVTLTEKALRRGFTNEKNVPVEGIVCVLPTHARGDGKEVLDEMVTNHEAGWAQYGARGTYRIVDVQAAMDFIEKNGGDVPFGCGK